MIYILRHGRTDWNIAHKLQGQTDTSLNEEGREMARIANGRFKDIKFDICYASPLKRASETAKLFLEGTGTPIIYDDRLKEIAFGGYEGEADIYKNPKHAIYNFFFDPKNYIADRNAESLQSLTERVGSFVREIALPEHNSGKNVLIVGHGAMNCNLIAQIKGTPIEKMWDNMTDNCVLTRVI